MFNANISHADWSHAFEQGMRNASTFRSQSNLVIMGAVVLFWKNSKNISYLNSALQYAGAYRGIRLEAVKAFLVHFTGAKFEKGPEKFDSVSGKLVKASGKFVKAGKLKAIRDGFDQLDSWVDWANAKKPEPAFDAKKLIEGDEKSIVKMLERKLDAAREALTKVRSAEEVDTDMEAMILNHIAHTEALKGQAVAMYN